MLVVLVLFPLFTVQKKEANQPRETVPAGNEMKPVKDTQGTQSSKHISGVAFNSLGAAEAAIQLIPCGNNIFTGLKCQKNTFWGWLVEGIVTFLVTGKRKGIRWGLSYRRGWKKTQKSREAGRTFCWSTASKRFNTAKATAAQYVNLVSISPHSSDMLFLKSTFSFCCFASGLFDADEEGRTKNAPPANEPSSLCKEAIYLTILSFLSSIISNSPHWANTYTACCVYRIWASWPVFPPNPPRFSSYRVKTHSAISRFRVLGRASKSIAPSAQKMP